MPAFLGFRPWSGSQVPCPRRCWLDKGHSVSAAVISSSLPGAGSGGDTGRLCSRGSSPSALLGGVRGPPSTSLGSGSGPPLGELRSLNGGGASGFQIIGGVSGPLVGAGSPGRRENARGAARSWGSSSPAPALCPGTPAASVAERRGSGQWLCIGLGLLFTHRGSGL